MRRTAVAILFLPILSAAPIAAAGGPPAGRGPGGRGGRAAADHLASFPLQAVDAREASGLAWIREEEKLARDVYSDLEKRWNLRVFGRIAQAEQRHMDEVKSLLDRYQLPDPAAQNGPGVFSDARLQALHDRLVAQGRTSPEAALKAGAEIEELDLADVGRERAATDNEDIAAIYRNLENGSGNHLRAFVKNLEAMDASYAPVHLSRAAFDEVVSGPPARFSRRATGGAAGASCDGSGRGGR